MVTGDVPREAIRGTTDRKGRAMDFRNEPKRDRIASFLLVLGWIALILAPVATLAVIAMSIIEGVFEPHIIVRLILMPFVFLWGLRQVRKYRQQGDGN